MTNNCSTLRADAGLARRTATPASSARSATPAPTCRRTTRSSTRAKQGKGSVSPQGTLLQGLLGSPDDPAQARERDEGIERLREGANGQLRGAAGRGADARLPARGRAMRTRGTASLAASPVLVGAVTVLVTIVAVFLSYNANTGLPFVPTYDLKANLPNGAQLVKGFEVRIGGARVGQVSKIEPMRREDGSTYAQITMKLDKEIEPLKADTTLLVRPRSAIGLKYVELTPGRGRAGPRLRRDHPVSSRRARRSSSSTTSSTCSTTRPASDRATRSTATAAGSPAAAATSTARSPRSSRCCATWSRWRRNLAARETRLGRLFQRARQGGLGGRAGGGDAGPAVREPRHDVHRARLDRPALPAGVDLRGPAERGAGHPRVPASRASSWPTTRPSSASCARASRRCRTRRRSWPTPSRRARGRCPRRSR